MLSSAISVDPLSSRLSWLLRELIKLDGAGERSKICGVLLLGGV
jgi:hypothetical protein